MTDAQVLLEWSKIRASHKRIVTTILRKLAKEKTAAFSKFGSSDVEQAARGNAVSRAESKYKQALDRESVRYRKQIEDLRSRAGEWADLVPTIFW